jgi:pimeloyl-ACP methyl ester carboxylesterase
VRVERLEIGTSFGVTHVNACGPRESPPLILLPGFGANSTMFIRNIEALSRGNRVYGIDTIGQPGRSAPSRGVGASDVHEWLEEVLDALGIGKANMAGVSLGGWIALDFAVRHPERAARVALVDPAASFAPMSLRFLLHSFIPIMIHPTRSGLVRYFRWMTKGGSVDREWGELMILGILSCKTQPPIRATPFSAKQLERCTAPLLLLIGENSVIYNPHRALSRASRLMPGIRAQVIPDASHALLMEQADLVNAHLSAFFES